MRKLSFSPIANEALMDICEFVEMKNTEGSGERFYNKFVKFVQSLLPLTNLKFPVCNNEELARFSYSCVIFQGKWVVAFSYTNKLIIIHRIVLGKSLR